MNHIWAEKVANGMFQIPRNSERGERHFPDVQTGTTAILRTKSLTKRAPWSATHVQNSSLDPFQIHRYELTCVQFQCPGQPYTHELVNGARASAEVWGGKDVNCRPARTHILLTRGYSWNAIFLLVYIVQVTFSAIGSRDLPSSETKETQEDHSLDERNPSQNSGGFSVLPPGTIIAEPCSPKSIFCQANKVRLARLLDYAVTDSSFA